MRSSFVPPFLRSVKALYYSPAAAYRMIDAPSSQIMDELAILALQERSLWKTDVGYFYCKFPHDTSHQSKFIHNNRVQTQKQR